MPAVSSLPAGVGFLPSTRYNREKKYIRELMSLLILAFPALLSALKTPSLWALEKKENRLSTSTYLRFSYISNCCHCKTY